MSAASLQTACDTQLLTLPSIDPTRIAWGQVAFTGDVPYWATQMAALTRRGIAVGVKGTIQWDGVYQVMYVIQSGHGNAELWAMLDSIALIFKKGLTLVAADGAKLIFDVPSMPPLLPSKPDWTQGAVRCPFFSFEMPS